jgi:NAD(P)-dependent dehydrogenase (short-subunit alcohol dehydrogenase family)
MAHLLKDRSVLVIGRAGGIAQATVTAVQAAGGQVIAAGRNRDELKAAYNDTVDVETIDLTDEDSIAELANRLGTVDHVVTTASARVYGEVRDLEPAPIMLSLATKVIGPLMLVKHFEPRMPRDGSFVLLGGIRSRQPLPGSSAVTATNGAVDAMTRALALELAPIRVNAVSPGTIDTGAHDRLGEEGKAELYATRERRNPVRRMGLPEDIASAVLFALTNTFLTGAVIPVDGGEPLVV